MDASNGLTVVANQKLILFKLDRSSPSVPTYPSLNSLKLKSSQLLPTTYTTFQHIMVLLRNSIYTRAFRVQAYRTARARAAGQSWRQIGRRSYATGHEGAKKASSDLPWYATFYHTIPSVYYILTTLHQVSESIFHILIAPQADRVCGYHSTIGHMALATRT